MNMILKHGDTEYVTSSVEPKAGDLIYRNGEVVKVIAVGDSDLLVAEPNKPKSDGIWVGSAGVEVLLSRDALRTNPFLKARMAFDDSSLTVGNAYLIEESQRKRSYHAIYYGLSKDQTKAKFIRYGNFSIPKDVTFVDVYELQKGQKIIKELKAADEN
ncbi:hypothetical protein F373_gp047 [Bacillus phage SP-10]|uniref:hypothetical protein n=1 Tax=Bacillus phage SP10 TaxID=941058 RepID=UPI0002198B03|nr:hypothetical protein F373_gp047 [Bacillus phage SP-10]BAK52859.1 hypothetical protein [Bacillus phage SP-10]